MKYFISNYHFYYNKIEFILFYVYSIIIIIIIIRFDLITMMFRLSIFIIMILVS